ncbi:unnamed protein product [Ilex paraguariensis]|uniref:Acyl-[acyl-carrier-protein] hydrolase n=1 Tax=Ilex paraguariensis TaxID=185542 RepID=A0ABC8TWR2_9AQUA
MVVIAFTSVFFPVASPPPNSSTKTSGNLSGMPARVHTWGIKLKSSFGSSRGLQVTAHLQTPPKVNGTNVGVMEDPKSEDETMPSPPPVTFINQLPDWSMLLDAITTIFLAAERRWIMLDWKPKRPDLRVEPFYYGRLLQDGLVFRQNFCIRSYEVGADCTATIETIMNILQETALNHVKTLGIQGDDFGATPEMSKRKLVWVVSKMKVLVDRHPTWGDVVQADSWTAAGGKNGIRRDCLLRDCKTGDILARASSLLVMMNKETRKLSRFPNEVRAEIGHYLVDSPPVLDEDGIKIPELDDNTADYVRTGLTPRWSDMDVNLHVNNAKYINWILESAPMQMLESHESAPMQMLESHEVASMTLEYKKECRRDCAVQSLTSVLSNGAGDLADSGYIECHHLLRLEGGPAVLKGRTEWRPKYTKPNVNGRRSAS